MNIDSIRELNSWGIQPPSIDFSFGELQLQLRHDAKYVVIPTGASAVEEPWLDLSLTQTDVTHLPLRLPLSTVNCRLSAASHA